MSSYRRYRVPGATYFFTVNLEDRTSRLLVTHVEMLREAFRMTRAELPYRVDAIVILPDHLHCIWTLPPNDSDFSTRWQRIKSRFSRACSSDEPRCESRLHKRERGIWQRRFWEHLIRDERDLTAHVDYIHYNPVKHSVASRVIDWPYSSFHRYVRQRLLPPDWAGTADAQGKFGEPT
jgi:putative transposase